VLVTPSQIEFLVLLAYSQLESGRSREAAKLLAAVNLLAPDNSQVYGLLALAQLRSNAADACLATLDAHRLWSGGSSPIEAGAARHGAIGHGKERQFTWIRMRALHASGQPEAARQLLKQLRFELASQRAH